MKSINYNGGIVEVYVTEANSFNRISFKEIKNGDTFIIYDNYGDPITDKNGDCIFIAISDPFIDNEIGKYTINYITTNEIKFNKTSNY